MFMFETYLSTHFEMVSVFDFVSSVAEFIDERRDSIMNVEPAALLMVW